MPCFDTLLQTLKHVGQANSSVKHVETASLLNGYVTDLKIVLMAQMKMIVVSCFVAFHNWLPKSLNTVMPAIGVFDIKLAGHVK